MPVGTAQLQDFFEATSLAPEILGAGAVGTQNVFG